MVGSECREALGTLGKDAGGIGEPDERGFCYLADRNRVVPGRAGFTHHETSRTTRATWRGKWPAGSPAGNRYSLRFTAAGDQLTQPFAVVPPGPAARHLP